MPATVTVTGVIGPAKTLTATVFTGVATFAFNTVGGEILTLTFSNGRPPVDISIAAATTITVTVSGSDYTVSVS